MAETTAKRLAIIAGHGTLDAAYPPLILSTSAVAIDMEADERKAVEIDTWFQDSEWLNQKSGLAEPGIKIHQDVRVLESAFKAPGGLIRGCPPQGKSH